MTRSSKRLLVAGAMVLVAAAVGVCLGAGNLQLYIHGKVASTDVRIIDNHAYVPVVDVAKALGMVVQQRKDGFELSVPGGTGQIEGKTQGKIGDVLFTGKWRFQVVSVEEAGPTYKERYYQEERTIKANGPGDTLLVLNCRLKNGLDKTQTPLLTEREPGNTALADTEDHSYPPKDYDARQESTKINSYAAESVLPGAAVDFALVFSVPKGTTPKSLVYSVQVYPDDVGKEKHTDVRVELQQ
jgi:hypothetical protein